MINSTGAKIGLCLIACGALFAAGRYSVDTTPASHTVTDAKAETDVKKDVNSHTETTIVKVQEKGKTVTTTKIDQVKDADTVTVAVTQTHTDATITPAVRKTLNLSVLVGTSTSNFGQPMYGLSVNKEVLGPITVGAYGLNNGTFGVSLGLNF